VRSASTGFAALIGGDHAALESSTILSNELALDNLLGRACGSCWARTSLRSGCCGTRVQFGPSKFSESLSIRGEETVASSREYLEEKRRKGDGEIERGRSCREEEWDCGQTKMVE